MFGPEYIRLGSYEKKGKTHYAHFDSDGALIRHSFRYLLYLRGKVAESSRKEIANRLLYVFRGLRRNGICGRSNLDTIVLQLRREHIEDYLLDERSAGLSSATCSQRELALKGLLDWLMSEEAAFARSPALDPYRSGELISKADKPNLPKSITGKELKSLLHGLHNESERSALHFMYDSGVRISELCRLRNRDLPSEEDFDSVSGNIELRVQGSKGRLGVIKERVTLLSIAVLARVRRYQNNDRVYRRTYCDRHAPDNFVFLNVNGDPLTPRAFSSQLKAAARRVKIDPEKIHPHVFRHSFAVNVLLSDDLADTYGERRVLLMMCLGHTKIETSEPYTKLHPGIIAERYRSKFSKHEFAKEVCAETILGALKARERRGRKKS